MVYHPIEENDSGWVPSKGKEERESDEPGRRGGEEKWNEGVEGGFADVHPSSMYPDRSLLDAE